jgi:hypothetical protein
MNKQRKLARAKYIGDIAIGIGLVATAGSAIYSTTTQAGIANSQLSLEQDQESKQDTAFNQLQALINNPASFFSSPVYTSAFNQGTQAVSRAGAAAGQNNTSRTLSGGQATALQAYGQSFGEQQLFNQEQLLAGMSGTGFNPTSAAGTASAAASSATGSLNSLAGLLSFFGNSGGGGLLSGGGQLASTAMGEDDWLAAQNTGEGLAGFAL